MLVLLLLPVSTASPPCSPAALTLLPPVSSPLPTSQLGKGQGRGQAGCFPSVSASENTHRWPELWAWSISWWNKWGGYWRAWKVEAPGGFLTRELRVGARSTERNCEEMEKINWGKKVWTDGGGACAACLHGLDRRKRSWLVVRSWWIGCYFAWTGRNGRQLRMKYWECNLDVILHIVAEARVVEVCGCICVRKLLFLFFKGWKIGEQWCNCRLGYVETRSTLLWEDGRACW